MSISIGQIEIKLENASFSETERLRAIIHTLIENGSLNIKGGHAIIHFDHEGNLQKIEHEFVKWTRKSKNDIISNYKPNLTKAAA